MPNEALLLRIVNWNNWNYKYSNEYKQYFFRRRRLGPSIHFAWSVDFGIFSIGGWLHLETVGIRICCSCTNYLYNPGRPVLLVAFRYFCCLTTLNMRRMFERMTCLKFRSWEFPKLGIPNLITCTSITVKYFKKEERQRRRRRRFKGLFVSIQNTQELLLWLLFLVVGISGHKRRRKRPSEIGIA